MNTNPRKQKYPRINLAFYGDNLDYVREASWKNRMSITEYINHLIDRDRKSHIGKDVLNELLSGSDDVVIVKPNSEYVPIAGTDGHLSIDETVGEE